MGRNRILGLAKKFKLGQNQSMKALSFCAITLAALPLHAGVRIHMETTDVATNKVTTQELLLDATRMRINTDGNNTVMFLTDGGRNRMVMLDKQKNEYREIDQQTMDQMAKQMQGAMTQMDEAMKNMSPQQREMMERMMKGKMPQMAAPVVKTVYTAKGKSTVNGFACTQYDGTRAEEKVAEVCAAQPSVLKFATADTELFEKMREFMSGFQKAMANSPFMSGFASSSALSEPGFDGYPVSRTTLNKGQAVSKQQLKSATTASFSDADFSLGTAKKVDMPMGPMGGAGRR
jgi:hypothetical protein